MAFFLPLLGRYWHVGLLALLLGVQTWRLSSRTEALEDSRAETAAEKAAHDAFANRVRTKALEIQRDMIANARRVETAQAQISEEVASDYQARIARLRADYDRRLRQGRTGGANPDSRRADLPGSAAAAGDPDGAAAQPVPELDRFAAEANSIQLEELQRWIRETLLVSR